ncbi:endonuclease domain-containing protein [Sphingomonas sp. S-NIH.Pt3_0716]|jgi:very-short-patch-repair endonuclease|nr:endonuclease domain-containing protein [Sphingomonas sp. S-NIH.Pt3_0716]
MRNYRDLPSGAVDQARILRRNATEAEKRLWRALREQLPTVKFRRQVPHGAYVADFLCFSGKLVVEVDGASHAESAEQDAVRTRYFETQGYHVLRFWNHEVMENTEGVVAVIAARLSPSPSHA